MKIVKISFISSFALFGSLYANAPFKADIIDHAESKPIAPNDRPSGGMQMNRRVDVTLSRDTIKTKLVPFQKEVKSRAYLDNGGVIWATSDPIKFTPHLDIKSRDTFLASNGQMDKPLVFHIYNNYSDFIKKYQLLIYRVDKNNKKEPIKLFEGRYLPSEIDWDIANEKKCKFFLNDRLEYVLRVYDDKGNFDQTSPRVVVLKKGDPNYSQKDDIEAQIFGHSNLKSRSIPIEGARVRVYGQGISPNYLLKIDGKEIRVDRSGKFVFEKIKRAGLYQIPISVMTQNGQVYDKKLAIDVKDHHLFLVALADVNIGKYSVSGNIKPLSSDEHYNEDIFVDGRLAFYLKGKIKGKYLITAQMDTQESDIKDMFKNIDKKDPHSIFRHLDPDKYYYVYGDDSTSYKDTDSQGKFYLRLDWDKSKALWGNFNSSITGNEFANINRSLYGAKVEYKSMTTTRYGDDVGDLTIFASEAQSSYAHNEFEGTGGSLYYLKNRDIVEGSEKVWVEIKERNSQRVTQKIIMMRGRDYEIDELQGRIILARPLSPYSKMSGPSIIKDMPLDGNRVVLKVDYEYIPDDFSPNKGTYGVRGKEWISDSIGVGATYGHEGKNGEDYEIKGADITFKGGKGSYIKAEFAQSDSFQTNSSFKSSDGGINFVQVVGNNNNIKNSGKAYGVDARVDMKDFIESKQDVVLGMWYKNRDKDFSSTSLGESQDVTDYGIEISSKISESMRILAKANALKEARDKRSSGSVEANYKIGLFDVGAEVRYIKDDVGPLNVGEGSLAGMKVKYNINSTFDAYIAAQTTISHKGTYSKNDAVTVGTNIELGRLKLNAEATSGDRGDGVSVGADYGVSDTYSVYGTYSLSTDRSDAFRDTFTIGQKNKITDALNIFTEHQFSHGENMTGVGHAFGIDYSFSKYLIANVVYNRVKLENGKSTNRDSISTGLSYSNKRVRASTKLEYRMDKATNSEEEQYLTSNKASYSLNPSWRVMGKFNYSKTKDKLLKKSDAKFIEAGVGFAYRPIYHDRFNLIGKYTYLYDMASIGQMESSSYEKSHIVSAEMSYQLSQRWTIGSKLGYKIYGIRGRSLNRDWSESNIKLAALRFNYHILKSWDAMLEGHWLEQEHDGNKKGVLIGVYKHIGDNLKLGIGYNFSDFSDDLTKVRDYSARGWFVNMIGKY